VRANVAYSQHARKVSFAQQENFPDRLSPRARFACSDQNLHQQSATATETGSPLRKSPNNDLCDRDKNAFALFLNVNAYLLDDKNQKYDFMQTL
jgi:hypothetical protein